MQKNKAIQILRALTPKEFKDFGRFVHSPYFNTSKDVIQLFTYIKKYYPSFDNKSMEIKTAAKKIKSGGAANEGTLRNTLSALNKLVREFLSMEFYKAHDFKMKHGEIYKLQEKNINIKKEFSDYFSKYGEMHELAEPYQRETLELYNLRITNGLNEVKAYNDVDALVKQSEIACLNALDYMIYTTANTIGNEYNNNFKYVDLCAEMFRLFDFEKFLDYTKKNSNKIYNIVSIEYYLLKMQLNKDFTENNEKVKEFILENHKNPNHYTATIFTKWLNSFTYQINYYVPHQNIASTAKMALKVIELALEKKVDVLFYQWFPLPSFLGYVRTASLSGEPDWINQFIMKYENLLNPAEKDFVMNFSKGAYHFAKGNFREALFFYSKVKVMNRWTIKVRFEMIVCHYELGNYETAFSLNEALIRYMDRKFPVNGKRWDVIEIKLFRKLLKITTDSTLDGIIDFEAEIKKAPQRSQFYVLKYLKKLKKNKL